MLTQGLVWRIIAAIVFSSAILQAAGKTGKPGKPPVQQDELDFKVQTWCNETDDTSGISQWDTSDISLWETSEITDMSGIFRNCKNPMLSTMNLNGWNIHQVTDMRGMFRHSNFDGDISDWEITSNVILQQMFWGSKFTGEYGLNKWDVSTDYFDFSASNSALEKDNSTFNTRGMFTHTHVSSENITSWGWNLATSQLEDMFSEKMNWKGEASIDITGAGTGTSDERAKMNNLFSFFIDSDDVAITPSSLKNSTGRVIMTTKATILVTLLTGIMIIAASS